MLEWLVKAVALDSALVFFHSYAISLVLVGDTFVRCCSENADHLTQPKILNSIFQLSNFIRKEIHSEANLPSDVPVANCLVITRTWYG